MTGCCCHRAVHTHTHTHTGAQTAITQKDTCTHSQTSNVLTRQAFCFLTHSPSVCLSPSTTQTFSHLTPPRLAGQLKQQLCSYISSSQPVCKPADPSHNDQCNGQTRVQNKERMHTTTVISFSALSLCVGISHGITYLTSEGTVEAPFLAAVVH